MDWREWFNDRGIPLLSTELGCDLSPEEMYQAFKSRLIEELQIDTSGLKGKLEERDG